MSVGRETPERKFEIRTTREERSKDLVVRSNGQPVDEGGLPTSSHTVSRTNGDSSLTLRLVFLKRKKKKSRNDKSNEKKNTKEKKRRKERKKKKIRKEKETSRTISERKKENSSC